MELKDIITSIAAIVGLGLSIYNFFHARSSDRVHLKVVPKASFFRGRNNDGTVFYLSNRDSYDIHHPEGPPTSLAIEVINLSKFSVTVDEVGLRRKHSKRRLTLAAPILHDGKGWPRKLGPRESVTVHFDISQLDRPDIVTVTHAYASTTCGSTCLGRSGALHDFVTMFKNAA